MTVQLLSPYTPTVPSASQKPNPKQSPPKITSDEDFARQLQQQELSKNGKSFKDLQSEFDKFSRLAVSVKSITPEKINDLKTSHRAQPLDLALPFSKSEIKTATQLQKRFDVSTSSPTNTSAAPLKAEKRPEISIPTFVPASPKKADNVTTITPYTSTKDTIQIINHGNVHFNPIVKGKETQAPGDGSCMYHSVLMALKEQRPDFKTSVSELRQLTADYIRNIDLAFFTNGKAERKEIADAQAKGAWGDNFALLAVSNLLNTNITVSFN